MIAALNTALLVLAGACLLANFVVFDVLCLPSSRGNAERWRQWSPIAVGLVLMTAVLLLLVEVPR